MEQTLLSRLNDIQIAATDTYMEIKEVIIKAQQLQAERDSLAEQVKYLEAELMRREGVA